jgi:uncharacterized delta-60 repeat protein
MVPVATVLLVLGAASAVGAPGDLDPTFAGGRVTTDLGGDDIAWALAVQPDGKLVVAGQTCISGCDSVLARYNSDGTLDGAFGSSGLVVTDFGGGDGARAIVMQPDGKLVVAGFNNTGVNGGNFDFTVARYHGNGLLDTSFGGAGRVTTDFGYHEYGQALVLQANGQVVVAGFRCPDADPCDLVLARYNTDGSLDTGFGTGGRVQTDLGGDDRAQAIALQADGKVVVAGSSCRDPIPSCGFALVRYNLDGSLDTDFGDGGVAVHVGLFGTVDRAAALISQPSGKLVAAGSSCPEFPPCDFALGRYTLTGLLDSDFGDRSRATTDFGADDAAAALLGQPDGRLVVAGCTGCSCSTCPGQGDFALARYNPNGALDATFGNNGRITTDFGGVNDAATALAALPDGRLVAAGRSNGNFALARYLSQAAPTDTPTPTPTVTATATATPSATPTTMPRLHLPLLERDPPPVVANGGFEQGLAGWTVEPAPLPVALAADALHGRVLLLGDPSWSERGVCEGGGIPLGAARVRQRVVVPDRPGVRLSFWYRLLTQDLNTRQARVDALEATVEGATVFQGSPSEERETCETTHDLGWARAEVPLEAHRGRSVELAFALWSREPPGRDRGYYNTYAYLDDVRIEPP